MSEILGSVGRHIMENEIGERAFISVSTICRIV